MATLKLTIDGSRAYADGRSLVIYRLTHKQQTTRIGSGVKVLKQDWDPLKCRINKSHPESKELNLILSKKMLDLEKKLLLITSRNSNLNISELKDALLLTEENKRFLFMYSYFFLKVLA
jgi:Arm DNA-binding domain